jgi:hypothetical protein
VAHENRRAGDGHRLDACHLQLGDDSAPARTIGELAVDEELPAHERACDHLESMLARGLSHLTAV